jgi:uncharacterized membrane protein YfcA
MLPVTVAGGLPGAALLLATPARLFDAMIPFLLLLATLTFAFGARSGLALRRAVHTGPTTGLIVQFLISIYSGYFGGAVGLMMMAGWSLLVASADLKAMAPARVLLVSATNGAAVIVILTATVTVLFFARAMSAKCEPARYWQRAITPDHAVGSVLRDNPNAFVSMNLKDT